MGVTLIRGDMKPFASFQQPKTLAHCNQWK